MSSDASFNINIKLAGVLYRDAALAKNIYTPFYILSNYFIINKINQII